MQTITYVVDMPTPGQKLNINPFTEPFTVDKIETYHPTDSIIISNDITKAQSRLVIINGKWQVEHYNSPHSIIFQTSPPTIQQPNIQTSPGSIIQRPNIQTSGSIIQSVVGDNYKIINGIRMHKIADNDMVVGDYGIYNERRYYDHEHPNGAIRKVPKPYIFIVEKEISPSPGRYGGRRVFVRFIGETPYEKDTSIGADGVEKTETALLSETPTNGWKMFKEPVKQPPKGETIEFYRP